ncbi:MULTISPECIES: Rid family hydrolase [unclassified Nocardia]|uniref:Rid family hydrolase n=1 Tax=unclassified Nocardia TaxID=2637762 RepID=UPI001CE3D55B|nr:MULTISPECIES: Rid family hydrolase [unclassified Nocardia]
MNAPFPAARLGSGLVFTSGLASIDPATMTPKHTEFADQLEDVLHQLDSALIAAGSSRERTLKIDCYLADRRWFPAWNAAFAAFFGATTPARTTTVTTLPIDGLLIEIQAVAVAG